MRTGLTGYILLATNLIVGSISLASALMLDAPLLVAATLIMAWSGAVALSGIRIESRLCRNLREADRMIYQGKKCIDALNHDTYWFYHDQIEANQLESKRLIRELRESI